MKVAIIPARAGSRRIPGKNKRIFAGTGLPIFQHSVSRALELGFNQVVVSTDDAEIAELAMAQGAMAMYRPAPLCADEIGTQEVMRACLLRLPYTVFDFACCIYATAPLMITEDLMRGFRVLRDNDRLHYAMSVGTEPLRDAGQFYWGLTSSFIDAKPLLSAHTAMIAIEEKRVCDINTEDDWQRAERMYKELNP